MNPGPSEDEIHRRFRVQLGLNPDTGLPVELSSSADPSELVKQYVGGAYTGAAFDTYGCNDPFAITPDDLIAVTMLSIPVNENSRSGIRPSAILDLQARTDEVVSLLNGLPADRSLHTLTQNDFDGWLGSDSPGNALYELMRKHVSLPRVATHKLLARKRPLLFPIRDTVVERALGLIRRKDGWWRPWWAALSTDEALVLRLREIRERAEAPHLSLLRVADIVIWLQNR
ncbi:MULTISPECIES: DUF6308 family protein [Mycobacterium avium complex (MAC)]|uniref:Uncharacterized protein n=1 Tax=Mycobacterium indicus pranii (strain DSM 45239 / MTCC 9506) TaxID=1232724 RepID=J9WGQ1_MYCIP|nr:MULTISPECIES: DUF6308 family protein [Mycobacterium avium complex (MAC)]AFS13647.1 Hypothetical protein MIP_02403 [Mycobacterium intracellulare subsp. intracellulare MTCC 9506]BCO51220.1 hypothetical protein MINTM003_16610 [Mycobacterium paraintracellulare]BCO88406.1 hypothetical protein MINTM015_16630 [Mycobacterium paraintracellulare]